MKIFKLLLIHTLCLCYLPTTNPRVALTTNSESGAIYNSNIQYDKSKNNTEKNTIQYNTINKIQQQLTATYSYYNNND